jgi:integrase
MPSDRVPSYRRHKQSGQAVVTLPDGLGGRRDVLLGKYKSKQSRQEYARVISEWEANGRCLPQSVSSTDITIAELIVRFWPWAEQHYRHVDGTPTGELKEWKLSLKPLRQLYGHTLAREFGPLALKAVREAMVGQPVTRKANDIDQATGKPKQDPRTGKTLKVDRVIREGMARKVVNQRIGRIKRLFAWGVENELAPALVHHGLRAVAGLQRGRSAARETEPVKPIASAFVEQTLPYLLPTVADMVRLQLLTGARSGEIVVMRACDIDTTGAVWLNRPQHHKTAHHGHQRIIALGPQAQEIVRRRLKPELQAYLFAPADTLMEKHQRDRENRRTKIYPSEVKRLARKRGKGRLLPHYTATGYAIAIKRAILKANRDRMTQGLPPIPHWHPHRLRHSAATAIRREFGLDVARAALGHRSPVLTEHYAEIDSSKAAEAMLKLG